MCSGWVRVCDDESESEIKVVYSQTSEPFHQSPGMGTRGWRRVQIKKRAPTIYKTPIRKETSKYPPSPDCNTHIWFLLLKRRSFQKGFCFPFHVRPLWSEYHSWGHSKALSGKVEGQIKLWDHSWCQLFCFNWTSLGLLFVGKEKKNLYPFGRHYTDSSNLDGS